MQRTVEPEVLAGFVTEARGYLLHLRAGIEALRDAGEGSEDRLLEGHRCAHNLRGAASMVGLTDVSWLGGELERAFEEVAEGRLSANDATVASLSHAADVLELLLTATAEGGDATGLVEAIAEEFARLRAAQPAEVVPAEVEPGPAERDEVDPGLLAVFREEAEDHLKTIAARLPALRERPDDREALQDVRRSAHTLKGSAAMVGFRTLTRLAHRMEDLLDLLFDGGRRADAAALDLLTASTDALEDLAAGGTGSGVLDSLYQRYDEMLAGSEGAATPTVEESVSVPAAEATNPFEAQTTEAFVRVPLAKLDELVRLAGELVIARTTFEQRLSAYSRQIEELARTTDRLRRTTGRLETQYEVSALGGRLRESAALSPTPSRLGLGAGAYGFDDLEFDRYTEFHLLSRELSETTADIQTVSGELSSLRDDFSGCLDRQVQLSGEIQDRLTRARMVPFGTLAPRLKRAVRNVAQSTGKEVELVLEGESVALDKALLDDLADPLLHLLRNAADHGVEIAEERLKRGKPERGTIRVRVGHEGNQIVLEVSDDGGGVDLEAVRAKGVARGLIAEDAEPGEEELLGLLFLPGFSTAEAVSETSGRGVGLDVVKDAIRRLRGTLALRSTRGEGTAFTVRLPMTLAVVKAVLVRTHGQTFAVPLAAVSRISRPGGPEDEPSDDPELVRVGDGEYRRVVLGDSLRLQRSAGDEAPLRPPVLVVNTGGAEVALVVDQLLGAREVVVKNLGNHLRQVHGVAGATLLGDGTVVLIVNPADLVRQPVRRPMVRVEQKAPPAESRPLTVMVVDDSPSVRRVLSNLLRATGWTPLPARDGLEALEILEKLPTPPDLMLVDVEMPRMDGYELLATVKSDEGYPEVPVVMVTSRAGAKHRGKASELGADGFLVKPYQDQQLLATIRRLADATRA